MSLAGLPSARPPVVLLGDLTLARPHGMVGIPVIAVTSDREDETLRSRYVRGGCLVPGFHPEVASGAASVILGLGARLHLLLGRKVPLVCGTDSQLELIYRFRSALEEHFLFLLNEPDLAWALHDKERFYEVATLAGVRVPRTRRAGVPLVEAIAELREPILVKPKTKTDWKELQQDIFGGHAKARVFATRAEVLAHHAIRRHEARLLIQEYIAGDVGDLLSFHGFADENSRILASFCGRKVRTAPRFAGESSYIELTSDAAVAAAGREVVERLGLRGPFKIDLIRDTRLGAHFTLEVNARFTLWHYLGARHGVNLPAAAYDYLVDGTVGTPPSYRPKHRWLSLYRDYHAFREQHTRGELGVADWLASLASPRNVYDVFAWEDPRPFLHWAGNMVRRRRPRGALRARL
jgi:predicted ATP-grasp superfamily ATP-dependent carboligase